MNFDEALKRVDKGDISYFSDNLMEAIYKMAKIEADKEVADQVFEAIETAKATGGKIKKGTNEVTKALERGDAKLVAIAKDVNPPEIVMHIPVLAEEKSIPCYEVASREELGASAGLQVATTAVAITSEGDAKKLIAALTAKKE